MSFCAGHYTGAGREGGYLPEGFLPIEWISRISRESIRSLMGSSRRRSYIAHRQWNAAEISVEKRRKRYFSILRIFTYFHVPGLPMF